MFDFLKKLNDNCAGNNGTQIDIQCNGNNVVISNGKVIVDGTIIATYGNGAQITINGDVNNIECTGSVEVKGNSAYIDCGGSCTVGGKVLGRINAGGSVRCGDAYGDISAGGSVHCTRR